MSIIWWQCAPGLPQLLSIGFFFLLGHLDIQLYNVHFEKSHGVRFNARVNRSYVAPSDAKLHLITHFQVLNITTHINKANYDESQISMKKLQINMCLKNTEYLLGICLCPPTTEKAPHPCSQ